MQGFVFIGLALVFSALAYLFPAAFTPPASLSPDIFKYTLVLIMLSMGLSLKFSDFLELFKFKKSAIFLGVLLQYTIMPALAFLIGLGFKMDQELFLGMMLVGTASGGTASNVIAYLAKGDLGLSVSMTLLSSLLCPFLMPLLMWLYVGKSVEVDAISMMSSLLWLSLAPILAGAAINSVFEKFISRIRFALPFISMLGIVVLISIIIALNSQNIKEFGGLSLLAVLMHNLLGLMLAYAVAHFLGFNAKIARTIAIEVAMQNSGLAISLAKLHFSNLALASLPAAFFSIIHNLSGALFAGFVNLKEKVKK